MRNKSFSKLPIQLIYAGGTFGCHGKPLTPITATIFEPLLLELLGSTPAHHYNAVEFLPNTCIKDSSQFTPADFVHFYKLILTAYQAGHHQFVLLTGTDTLSYLGAFLAEAFAQSDICIVLTGSMRPLFDPNVIDDFVLDQNSDALPNLQDALGIAGFAESGVRITFAGENWHAQTVQKIHSHDLMAFTGHHRAGYPANSYTKSLPAQRRNHWIDDQYDKLTDIVQRASEIQLPVIYCMPNPVALLVKQLEHYLTSAPTGMILVGFGAGNLPFSTQLADLLDICYKQGHMLVSASQCTFGGVSADYASGSWQYKHHVISGGRLTLAAIYARLLWLHLSQDTPARRRARWRYTINQADVVRS